MKNLATKYKAALRRLFRVLKAAKPLSTLSTYPAVIYVGAAASKNMGDALLFEAVSNLLRPICVIPNTPTSVIQGELLRGIIHYAGQVILRGGKTAAGVVLGGGHSDK